MTKGAIYSTKEESLKTPATGCSNIQIKNSN